MNTRCPFHGRLTASMVGVMKNVFCFIAIGLRELSCARKTDLQSAIAAPSTPPHVEYSESKFVRAESQGSGREARKKRQRILTRPTARQHIRHTQLSLDEPCEGRPVFKADMVVELSVEPQVGSIQINA